jgi:hypothetical protein
MPDRIQAAADDLRAVAHGLATDVEEFKRGQQIKNLIGALLLIGVLSLAIWNWRTRIEENHSRCVALNVSRVAIRAADAARGDSLVTLVETFDTHPSTDGRRFIAQLKAQNEATKHLLAVKLPNANC